MAGCSWKSLTLDEADDGGHSIAGSASMKRLTLMRHGDAQWDDPQLADLERPLNRRGISACQGMARQLARQQPPPELLLFSPAQRTRQTADIVARCLGLAPRLVVREDRLYLCAAAELLHIVRATGPRITHLLMIGHNPGLSEFAQQLSPAVQGDGLTTAAICSGVFSGEWLDFAPGQMREVVVETPPRRLFGLLR
ncbi:MAG: histidine phosphatase family protein [Proteobacteria bacterium]|nr:histidine phosphatase family protein [Pseudomonadota bacterium]